jgi:hypothetical protein
VPKRYVIQVLEAAEKQEKNIREQNSKPLMALHGAPAVSFLLHV